MIESRVPESVLDEAVADISRKCTGKYKPKSSPIVHSKRLTFGSGKDEYHMRFLVLNAPCLLSGSAEFRRECGIKPEDVEGKVYTGMNIVHAMANMTIDSYIEAIRHGRMARENEKKAAEQLHRAFTKIAESSAYKPIVKAIQEFASTFDSYVPTENAEQIIVSYMTASDKALTLSNVSKGLFWPSVIAGGILGAASAFFPPLLVLFVPLLGVSAASGFTGAASDERALEAIECTKAVNFACILAKFREMMVGRSDLVGDCNLCAMLYDDMSDVTCSKTCHFVHTLADVLAKHTNRSSICDFLFVEDLKHSCPLFKDYREGRIFGFYKDLFSRMETASRLEDYIAIQNEVQGKPSPEHLPWDKNKSK